MLQNVSMRVDVMMRGNPPQSPRTFGSLLSIAQSWQAHRLHRSSSAGGIWTYLASPDGAKSRSGGFGNPRSGKVGVVETLETRKRESVKMGCDIHLTLERLKKKPDRACAAEYPRL